MRYPQWKCEPIDGSSASAPAFRQALVCETVRHDCDSLHASITRAWELPVASDVKLLAGKSGKRSVLSRHRVRSSA
jgi:hypothetical protein